MSAGGRGEGFIKFERKIKPENFSIPAVSFSILQINRFLMKNFTPKPHHHTPALLGNKINQALGPYFYSVYSWVDPSAAILTEVELFQLLKDQNATFLYPNLAPWGATLFPKDDADVKYFSVLRNGTEYVCRTKATRQKGVEFYTEDSELFSCIICKDIISTAFHTYVYCFIFKGNSDFRQVLQYRKSFLRACYLHFKMEGKKLTGRNPFDFSQIERDIPAGRGNRGRPRRGRGYVRRGAPAGKLFG